MDERAFQHGLALFNAGRFFDAHEVWEDAWRAAPAEEKKFLQGLIQIAVALHHHSRGNSVGARLLLARAQRNLSPYPDSYAGLNLAVVRQQIAACGHALAAGEPCSFQVKLQVST
jgi:predicted metal-dependent hydrolase